MWEGNSKRDRAHLRDPGVSPGVSLLLEKIATFYDEQVSAAVQSLTSMIEPVMIGFMGFLVGGMLLPLALPPPKHRRELSRALQTVRLSF